MLCSRGLLAEIDGWIRNDQSRERATKGESVWHSGGTIANLEKIGKRECQVSETNAEPHNTRLNEALCHSVP